MEKGRVIRSITKRMLIAAIVMGIVIPSVFVFFKKIYIVSKNSISQSFVPEKIVCDVQDIYSSQLAKKIIDFVESRTTEESLLSFDQDDFYAELKENFAIIKKVSWTFCPPKTLQLNILGIKPLCKINNTMILGEEPTLFNVQDFSDSDLERMGAISVASDVYSAGVQEAFHDFVKKITDWHWSTFDISYKKSSHIELEPKKSPCRCLVITDEKRFFDTKKLQKIGDVFEDLQKKGFLSGKIMNSKSPMLTFDVRFKDRILVRFYGALKRGMG